MISMPTTSGTLAMINTLAMISTQVMTSTPGTAWPCSGTVFGCPSP